MKLFYVMIFITSFYGVKFPTNIGNSLDRPKPSRSEQSLEPTREMGWDDGKISTEQIRYMNWDHQYALEFS